MFKSSLVALLVASSLVATAAKAEGMYVGVGYAHLETSATDGNPFDGEKKGIADLRIGMEYNKHSAVEFRLSTPGKIKATDSDGEPWEQTYETSYGVIAKGMLPINEMFGVYGTAGVVRSKVKYVSDWDGETASESKTRLLFGAGVSITPVKNITVDIGYSQRGKFDGDVKFNAIDIGVNYRF